MCRLAPHPGWDAAQPALAGDKLAYVVRLDHRDHNGVIGKLLKEQVLNCAKISDCASSARAPGHGS
jgi:hypothetical protein